MEENVSGFFSWSANSAAEMETSNELVFLVVGLAVFPIFRNLSESFGLHTRNNPGRVVLLSDNFVFFSHPAHQVSVPRKNQCVSLF